jgi:hypothetical protein
MDMICITSVERRGRAVHVLRWLQPGTPLFIAHRPAHFGLLSQVPIVQSQYNLEKLSSKSRKLPGVAV